ncbi:DUF982 domain-containing protein [Pseudaminobacter soli (ex Li et al. 2025)]|uniref:DUF982 domain-containing protein n=1 Tax=Pseudaminobacter soli (ex Li et al. 2025) TaxID=1295366 RepID=A0A2P7SA85_9HYPH|nr:DUF982 domain-containing protein [Mesorhizobium soli]PSJ59377.1 DUF982 domain-containing protein [Mesorhizobium soli]
MENNRFENPITVRADATGTLLTLRTAREASDFLLNRWPGKRSDKHRAALQACSDVNLGNKPVIGARRAFVAAAREAGIFFDEKV